MKDSPAWPPDLQQAREALERVLVGTTDAEQIRTAKAEFLQAIGGMVYPKEIIPELIAFLEANGFKVGTPHQRQ